jgi:membrane protease YdiL (CAAX protease family)
MKTNFLLPHKWKKAGWIVFIPAFIFGVVITITDFEPAMLNAPVFAFITDGVLGGWSFFILYEDNIANEILGVLLIISAMVVVFSREKEEDELISRIRLESLAWAMYVNFAILLLAFVFVYDMAFFWVMTFNMFTPLIITMIRFNWLVAKLRKDVGHEE